MTTSIDIGQLPRTAPRTIRIFKDLGIFTYLDLLYYTPFRHEENPDATPISSLKEIYNNSLRAFDYGLVNEESIEPARVTVKGRVMSFKHVPTRRGIRLQKAVISDSTGSTELLWFNQFYLSSIVSPGREIQVVGKLKTLHPQPVIYVDEYDILGPDVGSIHTRPLVPIYPEKKGITSRILREKIRYVLSHFKAILPEELAQEIISYNELIPRAQAIEQIHFPESQEELKKARERLGFDELFTIQLSSLFVRQKWQKERVTHIFSLDKKNQKALELFYNNLPFKLTTAQKRTTKEIIDDLTLKKPMNRLLQGDVGSGKTVVSAAGAYLAYLNGFKTLYMAPTEILAQQHFKTLQRLLEKKVKISLFTSSSKPKKGELEEASIIVGTHALITKSADFNKVGLVVIDEQHKFGVKQRALLKKKGSQPHLLTMTATPIPRTVVLTLFGELDVCVLDEMPQGKKTVKTYIVPPVKRTAAYEWIKKEIKENKSQVFIVCPLIEESEAESLKSVRAAKKEFDRLKSEIFSDFKMGLLHGRLKIKEKTAIMEQFGRRDIDILVATPVVEVGIDFPNATVIVIEASERFGLAQLHQLRGRVGRGQKQSHCLLFSELTNEKVLQRLKVFSKISNGFELAEYDLVHRGSGEIYGTRQHGLSDLKIANIADFSLVAKTRKAAEYFITHKKLSEFAELEKRIQKLQIDHVAHD